MSESKSRASGLTRRGFLKGAGAAAAVTVGASSATGLVALAENPSQSDPDGIFYGQCRGNCTGGCRIKATVRQGKLVHTEMAQTELDVYDRICSKGLSHAQRAYSPARILYPLRRIGERGEGNWERISWDEAIEEISSTWKKLQADYGDSCIFFNQGSGNQGKAIGIGALLKDVVGGSSIVNSYDSAGLSMAFKTLGMGGFFDGNAPCSDLDAKTILVLGVNATDSMVNNFHFLQMAKDRGAKLIDIDPNYTMTAAQCDEYIPIRPGSDTALLLSMVQVCIENQWIDRAFLVESTVAPYLVKPDGAFLRSSDLLGESREASEVADIAEDAVLVWDERSAKAVLGTESEQPALEGSYEVNGITVKPAFQLLKESVEDWTPDAAALVCDMKAEDIIRLAKQYALEGPSLIFVGYGIDHYSGGHQAYHAATELMAVTGMAGKPGTGFSGCLMANVPFFLNNPHLVADRQDIGPAVSFLNMDQAFEKQEVNGVPVTPKALFCYAGNPVANMTERKLLLKQFANFESIVVVDWDMTETAEYADIVLPCCGWFECEDIGTGGSTANVNIQEQAVSPLGESKTDYEICQMLANAMGYPDAIPWTYEEYLEGYFDNDLAKMMGISLSTLREKKTLLAHENGEYVHGDGGVFPTPSTKLEFYLENFAHSPMFEGMDAGHEVDATLEHLAHFEPPHEAWTQSVGGYGQSEASKKYPLIYSSYRNRYRTHTQFFACDWLKEISPEPTLRMNELDAESRGLKNGDLVRAFNDRGEVVLRLEIHNGIRPGMVVYPKGFQGSEFVKGHCSNLTSRYTHPAMYNNCFFDAVCEVEKYEGE